MMKPPKAEKAGFAQSYNSQISITFRISCEEGSISRGFSNGGTGNVDFTKPF
jgi:hypothetical protein